MTDDTDKAEELLQESGSQKLHEAEASASTAGEDDDSPDSLEDAIADAFVAIDDGDATEHLTTRDRRLSALFAGLDDAGQLAALAQQAADELGRDESPETQADAIRLLLRYAIADLDEELLTTWADGKRAYERAKAERAADQVSEDTL
ncbi:hypothetical protein [Natrinema pallidum]|uniref:DUF8115 domain-containing protein n=1 Tax=Natrinema pallidum TaxID=69527 RepID=A0A4P9TJT5_9EURY|nr:hypothetical protein [Natrinema pallidum]QCW05271.1 hypothetical protein FGF80_18685 [Natrinema pallidum]